MVINIDHTSSETGGNPEGRKGHKHRTTCKIERLRVVSWRLAGRGGGMSSRHFKFQTTP